MQPLAALNLIESFEERMFIMYDTWARAFASDPKAVEVFGHLKLDELEHRKFMRRQRDLIEDMGGLKGMRVKIDPKVMTRNLELITQYSAEVPETWQEALGIAYAIESSAAEHYIINALKGQGGELGNILDEYSEHFSQHYSRVLDFIRMEKLAPISPEHQRLVQLRVPYKTEVRLDGKQSARACNISQGGLYVLTPGNLTLAQKLKLEFPMPGGVMSVRAVVRNVQEGAGAGLSFEGLEKKQAEVIAAYMERVMAGKEVSIPGQKNGQKNGQKSAKKSSPVAQKEKKGTEAPAAPAKPKPLDRVIIVNNNIFSNSDLRTYVSALTDANIPVLELKTSAQTMEALSDEVHNRAVVLTAETADDESFPLLGLIKRNPAYASIPLMVLSTSYDKRFITMVGAYGATFMHKMSLSPEKLIQMLA